MSQQERETLSRIFSDIGETLKKEGPSEADKEIAVFAGLGVLAQFSYDINRIADALFERNRLATIEANSTEQIATTLGALHDIYFNRGA